MQYTMSCKLFYNLHVHPVDYIQLYKSDHILRNVVADGSVPQYKTSLYEVYMKLPWFSLSLLFTPLPKCSVQCHVIYYGLVN